ncbi:hypothetical protein [Bradyrhizobium cajani]|uniref:Uncharacterized protein n=1 Tax=Bradyrhizobium cajani TaxID=1928661 RepID=A0A844TJ87_9BRAD|nr:hypothetical protein [Bradyrhizobium cajani]MCP3369651.1 hypothetical protein [Bradyrhizobium cajani]MVT75041.1 hypothetical protein [Bradyrhizobium cajani]
MVSPQFSGQDVPKEASILRISIDRTWRATEFSELFQRMETLNELSHFGLLKVDGQSSMGIFRSRFARRFRHDAFWMDAEFEGHIEEQVEAETIRDFVRETANPIPLHVARIQFASPGFTDLAGIGKVIGEIRRFVMAIVERYDAKEDRALARAEKEQTVISKKIANAERLLNLSNKMGLDHQTRNMMVRQALDIDRYIEEKVIDRQITSFD